jgi:RNA polymerase sigma-70 factor (ECF subfamily)
MTNEEIKQCIYEYGDDIYRFCCYLTNNKSSADDLYQETFLKAIEIRDKIRVKDNTKNYLISISLNLWKNHIKKNNRRKEIAPLIYDEDYISAIPDSQIEISETVITVELCKLVRNAIERLPEKQRIVTLLYYSEELSIREIGQMLHLPKGTVLSRLAKARSIIKKEMEDAGYGKTD